MLQEPKTFSGDFAAPPAALIPLCHKKQWVVWKWQRNGKDKWTKPPFYAPEPVRRAANNRPNTWSTHRAAVKAVLAGRASGIGFVLTSTEFAAVDCDKCRDPSTGRIDKWAQELLGAAPAAYHEVTVSGTGLRIIGTARGPETHRRFSIAGREGAGVEVYRHATRYITISGLEQGHCNELVNIDALIDRIVAEHDVADSTEKPKTGDHAGNGWDDIDNLIQNGAPETQRSEAFARCVWSLAGCGLGADEIEEQLRRYPNGIMAKYAQRLRSEIDRCYAKWQARQTASDTSSPHNWDDPDMSILDDRRGDLPNFPTNIFAPPIREWLAGLQRRAPSPRHDRARPGDRYRCSAPCSRDTSTKGKRGR